MVKKMTSNIKLKWKVDPIPAGRYRSFEKRGWPSAEYPDQSPAFFIKCEDEYIPHNIKTNNHKELTLMVAVYREDKGFDWRAVKRKFTTLPEAKAFAQELITTRTEWIPKQYRNNS